MGGTGCVSVAASLPSYVNPKCRFVLEIHPGGHCRPLGWSLDRAALKAAELQGAVSWLSVEMSQARAPGQHLSCLLLSKVGHQQPFVQHVCMPMKSSLDKVAEYLIVLYCCPYKA